MPEKAEEIPRFKYTFEDIQRGTEEHGSEFLTGEIVRQLGPLTYLVDVAEGCLWKRHVDHVKDVAVLLCENEITPLLAVGPELHEPEPTSSPLASVPKPTPALALEGKVSETPEEATVSTPLGNTRVPTVAPLKQYTSRARKPPDRYCPHDL